VTLATDKEKHRLASRAEIPVHDPNASRPHGEKKKLSRKDAAKVLASLVEQNMERKGLADEEKNRRVGRFAAFVDNLKRSRRKS
jgi:hypothetical protein